MSTRPSLIPVKRPSKLFLLLALLVLLGFGLYLRAYRLDELVIWLGDQGRDVTATWRMMQTGEPALLGPGSSVGRFQRGPIYYYLLLAGVAAGGGNPLGAAFAIVLLDLATTLLLFVAGRMIGGSIGGLAAAALYACSGSAVSLARAFSNPSVLPLFSVLLVVAVALWVRGQARFLPVVVAALVASWQIHDQALLLTIWALVLAAILRPPVTRRAVAWSLVAAAALLLPFAWHEAKGEWANLRAMAAFVGHSAAQNARPELAVGTLERLTAIAQITREFLPPANALQWALVAAAILSWLAMLYAAVRQRGLPVSRRRMLWVLAAYGALPWLYLVWPGPLYASNLEIVLPVPFLLVAYGCARLVHLDRRAALAASALVVLVCSMSAAETLSRLAQAKPTAASLGTAQRVVDYILNEASGKPILWRLDTDWEHTEAYDAPWRYLLEWRGARLATTAAAVTFVIISPAERARGERQAGTLVQGIRVVQLAPARALGANRLRGGELRTAADVREWILRGASGAVLRWDAEQQALVLDSGAAVQELTALQRVDVEPDSDYLVSFEARSALQRGSQKVYVLCFDARHNFLATLPLPTGYEAARGEEWQQGTFVAHTPPGCVLASLWLRHEGAGASWFRNVQFNPTKMEILP